MSYRNSRILRASTGDETLVLHMGSQALRTQRGIAPGEINEKFIVRQMETSGRQDALLGLCVRDPAGLLPDATKVGTGKAKLIADAA